eukprot:3243892-Rhodomonas_salina.2
MPPKKKEPEPEPEEEEPAPPPPLSTTGLFYLYYKNDSGRGVCSGSNSPPNLRVSSATSDTYLSHDSARRHDRGGQHFLHLISCSGGVPSLHVWRRQCAWLSCHAMSCPDIACDAAGDERTRVCSYTAPA